MRTRPFIISRVICFAAKNAGHVIRALTEFYLRRMKKSVGTANFLFDARE